MRIALTLTAIASFTLGFRSALASDYAKVDRSIGKEPQYQSKSPRYARLVFGREMKLRIWVVLDGNVLYIDRNADGDLTAADERVDKPMDKPNGFMPINLADSDGKTRYVITHVGVYAQGDPPQDRFGAEVEIKGPVEYSQYCDTALEVDPQRAAIAHFHGPLTIGPRTVDWKVPSDLALKAGEDPANLPAIIGTMDPEYGVWVVVRTHNGSDAAFPKDVIPYVDVEFAPKTGDAPNVKKRYPLEKFC